jgi:[ribosomal protein S5]-alanine N-acetyltransferase
MAAFDYEKVAFKRLTEIRPDSIIELMNDPAVRRHLPLARGDFGESERESFVAAKERMWEERGFGPWAFVLDGEFIGWGGLQPEGDDVDLGLVLRRKHWGAGPVLCRRILTYAFEELGVDSVIALLPPSRIRVAALRRLGFREDGEILIEDQRFVRYRLRGGSR